jgi:hypothetical protein
MGVTLGTPHGQNPSLGSTIRYDRVGPTYPFGEADHPNFAVITTVVPSPSPAPRRRPPSPRWRCRRPAMSAAPARAVERCASAYVVTIPLGDPPAAPRKKSTDTRRLIAATAASSASPTSRGSTSRLPLRETVSPGSMESSTTPFALRPGTISHPAAGRHLPDSRFPVRDARQS